MAVSVPAIVLMVMNAITLVLVIVATATDQFASSTTDAGLSVFDEDVCNLADAVEKSPSCESVQAMLILSILVLFAEIVGTGITMAVSSSPKKPILVVVVGKIVSVAFVCAAAGLAFKGIYEVEQATPFDFYLITGGILLGVAVALNIITWITAGIMLCCVGSGDNNQGAVGAYDSK